MGEPRFVLASSSPRRAPLLARLGLVPVIRATEVDETPREGEAPPELVSRLAEAKAHAGHRRGTDEVVLAADTVVVLDGQALGKPVDDAEATATLQRLSGRTHEVLTGLAVHRGREQHHETVCTRVRFRELSDLEVAWYVGTREPRGKAGSYALQGAGAALVDHLEGSETNVIGLPLPATVLLLRRAGLEVLAPRPGDRAAQPERS